MYNVYKTYPGPYYDNRPFADSDNMYQSYRMYPCPYCENAPMYYSDFSNQFPDQYLPGSCKMEDDVLVRFKDYGAEPFVVNIEEVTKRNKMFRTTLWTGTHLQLTLMSINPREDIGFEVHPDLDQFIRIEEGQGLVMMGDHKDQMNFQERVADDFAFIIPAGKWHNLINTGNKPLKLYSIYAPPQHPMGTVHETKEDALAAE